MEQQQIVISGVGGQGVLFLTRLLAEAALELEMPVLSSETHGMAQRGGTVVSHLKVGPSFHSPLIRSGQADIILLLHHNNLGLHGHFLHENGQIFINSHRPEYPGAIDAAQLATSLGYPLAANLVLLGFALASGSVFCDFTTVCSTLQRSYPGDRLQLSIRALQAGFNYDPRDMK
ncbi:MAG: 2-oxoacid:acceptor oxidoreductase family protein [Deltaproteobacteria bacterium]|nr:2-oxoacid:acceptor oxidoreductase family protein [Deltaproteobacteria bacterium]MBW2070748.1 2-oxoacid:acceptor oxidoreductase family protein [Deltaproteobacteria bacterium]